MVGALTGQAAVVTGASRGIGRAIAAKLVALGADVGVVQRGGPPEVGERVALAADLADPESAARAVEEAADRLGRLDVLVCNAGGISRGPALDVPLSDWRAVLELNLTSVFAQAQTAARRFRATETEGRIVLMASMLSFGGGINTVAYAASKGGVAQLTKALANEWAPLGIRVNAIAPGWVETEMTEALRANPERVREITARIPAGRWAKPEEIAGAAAFLVSPAAGYVHGHLLAVDGGYLAR